MSEVEGSTDPLVKQMISARTGSAALKHQLIALRSRVPTDFIFVFEGVDDKVAYGHWIERIAKEIKYEPHPCGGKGNLLSLRSSLLLDVNGLSTGVFFFVDRDFDGLRGQAPDASTFMTTEHSIDNVIASEETLGCLLRNEFHCHGNPAGRAIIVELFKSVYSRFLEITRPLSLRCLSSERFKIEFAGNIASKIGQIAEVSIDGVAAGSLTPEVAVPLAREPSESEISAVSGELPVSDAQFLYRGKFAMLFFVKWLELLKESRNQDPRKYFGDMHLDSKVQLGAGMTLLASRSPAPRGLDTFLGAIVAATA